MELLLLRIILVLASLLTISTTNSEGDALLDMKLKLKATGNQLSDWNWRQINPCTWYSVVCDNNNNVVQVTLPSMGFTGVLSPRIGELKHLNVLILSENHLSGTIPDTLASIPSLRDIRLAYNNLSGQIPGRLFHVAHYNFSGNSHLNCGPKFHHPCASHASYQEPTHGHRRTGRGQWTDPEPEAENDASGGSLKLKA
ncbi:unnamed protein product [Urochloa decumbens]|uniref:Leucine-rich repeat-containing N-terminal plant-type domain-containing protein n=1 Tax=Urochloa decumbens TaxID=240449 RepID=A0ABC8Y3U4_9POAL